MAAYDNTVAYNDSIVFEITQSLKNDDALILYFSDHALDLFDTSDDYYGHAKHNDTKSEEAGRDVPFMAYLSPQFKEKHSEIHEKLLSIKEKPFHTTDMIHLLMNLLSVNTPVQEKHIR